MKLWILKARKEFTGYLRNQNIVVRAENEKEARELAAYNDCRNDAWLTRDYASCEELTPVGEESVVIVDNNGS